MKEERRMQEDDEVAATKGVEAISCRGVSAFTSWHGCLQVVV